MENQKGDASGSALTRMLSERPELVLARDARRAAVLEPRPLADGHVLVFPVRETDAWSDLADDELASLVLFAKRLARAIRETTPCDKVAVLSYGLKVRHAHLHLVPVSGRPGEIDLNGPRTEAGADALERAARRIRTWLRERAEDS